MFFMFFYLQINVFNIYAFGFSRKKTLKTVGSRVNALLEHLFLAFESNNFA